MKMRSSITRLTKETLAQIAKGNSASGFTINEDGDITLFRDMSYRKEYLTFMSSIAQPGTFVQLGETWRDLPYLPSDITPIAELG